MKTKNILLVIACASLTFFANDAAAEKAERPTYKSKAEDSQREDVVIDRSKRTSPYASTPSYAQGGNSSRYSTSAGWSRGQSGYWWHSSRSDMPTTGYTAPSRSDR